MQCFSNTYILFNFIVTEYIPKIGFSFILHDFGYFALWWTINSSLQWDRREQRSRKRLNKSVLIIGAGQAGEGLVRDLKRSNQLSAYRIVDDNISKRAGNPWSQGIGTTVKLLNIVRSIQ